jgi:RNA polymerase sigma-70 factor (ECF subfamily)
LALDHLRHQHVVLQWETLAVQHRSVPTLHTPLRAPDARLQDTELSAAINQAIGALPERCRQAFTLKFQHGLSYREIATVMETTVKTVENHIGRALRLLRESLSNLYGAAE